MTDLHCRIIEHCEGSYYKLASAAMTLSATARQCAESYWNLHDGRDGWDQSDAQTFALHDEKMVLNVFVTQDLKKTITLTKKPQPVDNFLQKKQNHYI